MLKGAQKRMIVVKTQDSRIFEEAYFVMRGEPSVSNTDIVSEANKIIESSGEKRNEKKKRSAAEALIPLFTFIAGSIAGGGAVLAIMLIVM